MDPTVAAADTPAKDPYLPRLHRLGDLIVPSAPQDIASAGLDEGALADLMLRLAYGQARFSTQWTVQQLRLSLPLVLELLFSCVRKRGAAHKRRARGMARSTRTQTRVTCSMRCVACVLLPRSLPRCSVCLWPLFALCSP